MISALTLDQAVAELVRSPEFQAWRKPTKGVEKSSLSLAEKHWTPQELAEIWGVSVQTIREIFQKEEGVLKIGRDGTRSRRRYKTLRIPESVAERVHTRLSA
jgi:hypothetical protein